ncbi:MAG: FliH/SctL family protein [Lachnospiraceae bacterium]
MSNLIKSGFVAFSQDNKLVIDANQNKIIQAIDSSVGTKDEETMEEALAEALIRDAELDGVDFGDDVLTLDTSELPNLGDLNPDLNQVTSEVLNSAKQEAEDIINGAHDEAEQLRANAYDEAEQIRKNAYDEGYETGYQEAVAKANEELSVKLEEIACQKQALQEEQEQFKSDLLQETEKRMVDILCKLIHSVTGVAIENQKNVLLYMINRAMQDQDNSKHFVIKLSSKDFPLVSERKNEIYGAMNPNIDIELFEDAKLSDYQCIIETDNGMVDLSLDVQLNNLTQALKLMIKD